MTQLLAAALRYAVTEEWAVFPCIPRGKRPITPNGFKNASTDPATITDWWRQWPDANIGIDLEASGLIVIDVDGPQGWEPLERLKLADTRLVGTGREEGGAHYYYRVPDGCELRSCKLTTDLEVKGAGGYVIAPPSIHPTGAKYQTDNQPIHTLTLDELARIRPAEPEREPVIPKDRSGDPLQHIEAPDYVWLLTGTKVSRTGHCVCPFPDHDDWDGDGGSFMAYTAGKTGFHCFGCNRGGDIYNFATILWNHTGTFPELRKRLVSVVIGDHA